MPRKCAICIHPKLDDLNRHLLEGEPLRPLAKRFGVTYDALYRHNMRHLPSGLLQAQAAAKVASADTLLEQVCTLRDKALSLLDAAEHAGDLRTALVGVRETRACLELLAKLQGELAQEGTTVNVLFAPQWLSLRTVILQALDPYPEAKARLVEALDDGGVIGDAAI